MMNHVAHTTTDARAFWENAYAQRTRSHAFDPAAFSQKGLNGAFLDLIGDVEGKSVLDIGCGAGQLSVCLALRGATVTAVDYSANSIQQTLRLAEQHGVEARVQGQQLDALALGELGRRFDVLVGKFILHHIEPFDLFADVLHERLESGGRGVFYENNARNPILMFARSHLAGRFGIPKYGDDEEFPLQPEEIEMLEARFARVELHVPTLVFFRKINTYIFRHNPLFRPILALNAGLDRLAYQIPALRKYSYNQLVEFEKA